MAAIGTPLCGVMPRRPHPAVELTIGELSLQETCAAPAEAELGLHHATTTQRPETGLATDATGTETTQSSAAITTGLPRVSSQLMNAAAPVAALSHFR